MEVFGITGTNGKTTTAYMLNEILCKCGFECAVIGTVEHRIGEKVYEAKNTTPGKELCAFSFVTFFFVFFMIFSRLRLN